MAAIFVNAKKHKGYIHKLNIAENQLLRLVVQDRFKNHADNVYKTALGVEMERETQQSNLSFEQYDDLDPKHLWKKLIMNQDGEIDVLRDMKRKLIIIDTISAVLSCIHILLSIYEYESFYYKTFYEVENPESGSFYYDGIPIRFILLIISLVLVLLCVFSRLNMYRLKCEQQKLASSKLNINFR